MKYLGSKAKFAKELCEIFNRYRQGKTYVEPFVGGANVICEMSNPRIGGDSHRFLIAFLKAIQQGWRPPETVSYAMYQEIRQNQTLFPDCLIGYVGFCCSYSGKFFGGYARTAGRDFTAEAFRHITDQIPKLQGIDFHCCEFYELPIPDNSLIYCDPPYQNTTGYDRMFNYPLFWDWVREQSKRNIVFVSEYNAPKDFECVWYKYRKQNIDIGDGVQTTERLFRWTHTKN